MHTRAQSIKVVFDEAAEIESPAERAAFLDRACAGDAELRRAVEDLLRAYSQAGSFLEQRAAVPTETEAWGPGPAAGSTTIPAGTGAGPGTAIGPYELLERLGEGGMGEVWRARQARPLRREVAIKLIKPGMDTHQVIARFEAERQALALMDHPNIARVLDAGASESGRPYFVMELVKGVPITEYCDRNRLTPKQRLELFIPVCRALQHAHQKGIIHRDVKPSNVLVTIHDGNPVPKVIDFGIAKAIDRRLTERTLFTQHGAVIGTPEYMSPEQAGMGGLDVDTRSDVYSLGVLLYELLTGSTPLRREALRAAGLDEVLRRIREEEPPRPSTRLSQSTDTLPSVSALRHTEPARLTKLVRRELDWIVMKALEKDRARRYETAGGLARDVERYLDGEPVEAGPPSAAYRLRKYALKHRAGLATALAFAAVLIAATAVSSWLAVRATRAERDALRAYAAETEQRKAAVAQRDRAVEAEAQAKEEEKRARQSESESKAVLSFFRDKVLAAARPEGQEGGLGKDVTLRAAIDAAESSIAADFAEQPTVEAAIRSTLGESYGYLGDNRRSVEQMERARTLRVNKLGPDHPDTLDSMGGLAWAYLNAGRTEEAIRLNEETLKLRQAKLGPDHPDTLTTRNNLATAYWSAGQIAQAIKLHEENLALRTAKQGPDHPDTLHVRNNLALAYWSAGRIADAIALDKETLRLRRAKLGPEHPDTLNTLTNLGVGYWSVGRNDEAIALHKELLGLRTAKQGPDHPETLTSRNNLALAYYAAGRFGEAIELDEETLKLRTARLGADHPDTLSSMNNLATSYQAVGRLDKAITLFEKSLELKRGKLAPGHPNTLLTMNNLNAAYVAAGRWADAEKTARECLAFRDQTQPRDWWCWYTLSQLGAALAGQKRYVEAEPLLTQGFEGMKSFEAKIPAPSKRRLSEAAGRIVPFYEAWGKPEKAAEWRARLKPAAAPAGTSARKNRSPWHV